MQSLRKMWSELSVDHGRLPHPGKSGHFSSVHTVMRKKFVSAPASDHKFYSQLFLLAWVACEKKLFEKYLEKLRLGFLAGRWLFDGKRYYSLDESLHNALYGKQCRISFKTVLLMTI